VQVVKTVSIHVTGVLTVNVAAPERGYVGLPVTVTANWNGIAVGPFQGLIKWGDGTQIEFTSTAKSVTRDHTYSTSGSYTVTVSVSDEYTAAGGSGTAATTIAVQLSALLSASPTSGVTPLAVTFTCSAAGGFLPYAWSLDPGDGSAPYTGTRPGEGPWTQTHTYTKLGTYAAKLTVTDALGAAAVTRATSRVYAPPGPPSAAAILTPLVAGLILLKGRR